VVSGFHFPHSYELDEQDILVISVCFQKTNRLQRQNCHLRFLFHFELPCLLLRRYTKTGLVFGFSKNQILVAVIPGQKAPRTLLGQNYFWIFPKIILR
jgi:hypothetical protein